MHFIQKIHSPQIMIEITPNIYGVMSDNWRVQNNFWKFLQRAVPDISHCFAKFRFENTHISLVSISKNLGTISLIFYRCIAHALENHHKNCRAMYSFFHDIQQRIFKNSQNTTTFWKQWFSNSKKLVRVGHSMCCFIYAYVNN